MNREVKDILWHHFNEAGIFPDTDFYTRSISRIHVEGQEELNRLYKRLQTFFFRQPIDKLCPTLTSLDLVRVLGFGRLLTSYFLSPLDLPSSYRETLIRSGALANLIITLFDHLLDHGLSNKRLIKENWLDDAKRKSRLEDFAQIVFSKNNYQRLMFLMIRFYFKDISDVVRSSGTLDGQKAAAYLQKIIRLMHAIELKTVDQKIILSASEWRKKSSMPFIVMGITGWILKNRDDAFRRWHMRWIYQTGILLGSVDDAIDYTHDVQQNSYNYFLSRNSGDQHNEKASSHLCELLKRLSQEWQSHASTEDRGNPLISNALNLTICSWFGGPYWEPAGYHDYNRITGT